MALADSTKVDFLWKKLGFGVAKTAPPANKEAFNESIPSPLLMRADKVWQSSASIPGVKPSASSSIVEIYQDAAGGSATVECTEDLTAPDNQTWKTNLTDWIPTEFGSTYLVKVYVDDAGESAPQTTGTQLFQAGSGNEDGWFFDYQAGVLNFNGENIPSQIGTGVTGKSIYIVGARYIGPFGVGGGSTIGNLTVTDTTISTSNAGSDIILETTGNGTVNIDTTTALQIAVGNTAQRPATPSTGDLRFNTTNTSVEVYNGTSWENVGEDTTTITSQTFSGDNSTVAFTLNASATTASVIVSINGTVQAPTTAYAVSGTTLTFTEAPASGDAIEVRQISATTTVTAIQNVSGNAIVSALDNQDTVQITGNLLPSANATYNLGSDTARWNDLYLAGSTLILGNVVMKNTPGGNSIAFYGPDGTTPATIDANVEIVSDSIAAGTSNVSFAGGGGNVQIIVGGIQTGTITSTGANIAGYITATGNITANNFNGNVTGNLTGTSSTADAMSGAVTVALTGPVTGSATFTSAGDTASIATTLTADPTITLTGAVTGSATMTNLGNVSITTTATSDPTITLAGDLTGSATLTNLGNATLTATLTKDPTITLTGAVTGSATMTNLGNVSIATIATSDPTITLAGDLTGSATLTNLGNATLTATIAANSVALGTDTTGNYVESITNGNYITGGNGGSEGAALTLAVDATDQNTASKVVARDASGNFSAGTISANLTGNADTATTAGALTTARAIQLSGAVTGTANFDGSTGINIVTTATSDPTITLTGDVTGSGTMTNLGNVSFVTTIAANSVALGTDTTGSYVQQGATSGSGISGSVNSEAGTFTVTSNATSANTANTIVFRDASGDFSAGIITATATQARYADVAENFKVNEFADAGTVMVFNKDGLLVTSNHYADPMLVGVVSTDPAHLLNKDLPNGQPIALAGQVPCKVVGPVKVGDLLTTSNTPGYATVLDLNDWKPGITIGKSMENCGIGKHTITVFVGSF